MFAKNYILRVLLCNNTWQDRRSAEVVQLAKSRSMVVVPAFNAYKMQLAYDVAFTGKAALLQRLQTKEVVQFQWYTHGHDATNYSHWVETETFYEAKAGAYSPYEPWGILLRSVSLQL